MTCRRIVIVVFAILGSFLGGHASDPPGVDQGGLRLVVTSDKPVYSVGEPVRISLIWTNIGSVELRIPSWKGAQMGIEAARHTEGQPTLYALVISYDGQHRIPYHGSIGCGVDNGFQLAPGERHESAFSIEESYDIRRAARYVVRVAFAGFDDDHAPPHAWQGLLVHPDIEFSVRAKGEQ